MNFISLHTCISIVAGFCIDLVLGDPYFLPHPIRLIGSAIQVLQSHLLRESDTPSVKRKKGMLMVLLVVVATGAVSALLLLMAYHIHPLLGIVVETIMCYQILATKCLKVESMKVYMALKTDTLKQARKCVSMIVGRDTESLSAEGVTRAAVETVAENTADGIVGPLFCLAIGGPILGFCYKAVNTMDSMVGYKNDQFIDFGWAAAKLDDLVNYLPARLSAGFMIGASFLLRMDWKNAVKIYRRDRFNHASPNSAHTESVAAGALDLQLAGNAWYFGKLVEKPSIGDPIREIEVEDIRHVNSLLYATAILAMVVFTGVRFAGLWILLL